MPGSIRQIMKKLLMLIIAIFITACYDTEKVEEVSCDIVTQLIQDEWNMPTSCGAVKLGKSLRKNYYQNATAYLRNGCELGITVEIIKGYIRLELKENPVLYCRYRR